MSRCSFLVAAILIFFSFNSYAQPAAIAGAGSVCSGRTLTLTDATSGGTWSSSNSAVATITAGGVVGGVASGKATISYTTSGGSATAVVTVNTTPVTAAFTVSPSAICAGAATTFTRTASGCSANAVSFTTIGSAATGTLPATVVDNITIEGWVKWSGANGASQIVFYNGNTGSNGYGLMVNATASNTLSVLCGGVAIMNSSATLTAGVWQHVGIVRNAGTWTIYLDGMANVVSTPTATPATPTGNFLIGNNVSGGIQQFNGAIDEVLFWTAARTAGQILADRTACSITSPQTNLKGYWKLEEGTGTTTADASGNSYTLTLTTPGWTPLNTFTWAFGDGGTSSVDGVSYTYSAVAAYTPTLTVTNNGCSTTTTGAATVNPTPSAAFTTSSSAICSGGSITFTAAASSCSGYALNFPALSSGASNIINTAVDNIAIEGWVKWVGNTGASQILFYNGNSGANGYGLIVNSASGNTLSILCGGVGYMTSSAVLTAGVWQHVAMVRSAGTWVLYIDNAAYTLSTPATTPAAPSGSFVLGNNAAGGPQYFNGTVDEVKFWTTARTAAQVQADRITCNTPAQAGLAAYWKLEEGTGVVAADASGNGNTLVLTGTTRTSATPILSTYAWAFGDGGTASVSSVAYAYTTAATYNPTLTVTNAYGCMGSFVTTLPIVVRQSPDASFTTKSLCTGTSTSFSPCNGTSLSFGSSGSASRSVFTTAVDNITMEGWVKWGGANSQNQVLFYNGDVNGNGYGAVINSANANTVSLFLGGLGFFNTSALLTTGVWQHVAIVRTSGSWSLYVDGVAYAVTSPTTTPSVPSGLFLIGNGSVGGALQLNGTIDEVSFWSVARTTAQMQGDRTACSLSPQSGLLAYWSFSDASGSSVTDGSGNNRTLAATGTAWSSSTPGPIATYAWSFGDGGTSTVGNPSHSYTAAGSYTAGLTVTDTTGCTSSSSGALTIVPPPQATIATSSSISLCAGTTLTLTAGSTSGTGTVAAYNWSGPNSYSATGTSSSTSFTPASPLASGIYSLTVTYTGGCNSTAVTTPSVTVVQPVIAGITPSNTNACAGTTLILTAGTVTGIGATLTSYTWTGPSYNVTTTASVVGRSIAGTTGSGAYSVKANYSDGCSSNIVTSDIVTTRQSYTLAAVSSSSYKPCAGASIVLTRGSLLSPTGGYSISSHNWSGPGGYSATTFGTTNTFVPALAGGSYSVTVTNNYGCTSNSVATPNIFVINPVLSGITASAATICAPGGTLTLTANTLATVGSTYSYKWSRPVSTDTVTPTRVLAIPSVTSAATGTYSVSVLDSGCYSSPVYTNIVVDRPVLSAISGNFTICTSNPQLFTDTATGGTWSSSNTAVANVSPTGLVTGLTADTCTITYTKTNSCGITTAAAAITVTAGVPAITGAGGTLCTGTPATLSIATTGGTWSSSAATIATVSGSGVVSGLATGTATISYTKTLACGAAFSTVTYNVGIYAAPAAITGSSTLCAGSSISLNNSVTGGRWSSSVPTVAAVGSITNATPRASVTGISRGVAIISYTVGTGGCTTLTTMSVTVNGISPSYTSSGITGGRVCAGDSLQLKSDTITASSWSWAGPNGFTSTVRNPVIAGVTGAASGVYTFTATTAGCTAGSSRLWVAVGSIPSVTVTPSVPYICPGGTLSLTATALPASSAGYNVYAIPYNLQTLSAAATLLPPGDDTSYNIPLPFTFNFYGANKTSLYVNINGSVSFETPISAFAASTLPIGPTYNFSLIGLGMADVYTTALGSISYETIGSAPNRKFVVYYKECASYGNSGAVGNGTLTGQIILYETTNIVELMIGRCDLRSAAVSTTNWTYTFGMQNSDGSAYTTASGLNNTLSPVLVPQGWRFAHPGSYSYVWTPVATLSNTAVSNPVSTGLTTTQIFSVTTTDINSTCTTGAKASDTVIVNSPVIAGLTTSSATVCAGASITLTAGAIIAYGPATTYYWSGPGGYNATTTTSSISVTPASSGLYSVAATNATGCIGGVQTSSVTVNALPVVANIIPSATSVCVGAMLTLTGGAVSGVGTLQSYNWSGPNGYSATGTTSARGLTFGSASANGSYSLTVTYTGGCISPVVTTPVVTAVTIPVLSAIAGNFNVCVGTPQALSDTATGGMWSSRNTAVASVSPTGVVTGLAMDTCTIMYSKTNACGIASATAIITVIAGVPAITGASAALCSGTPQTLSVATTGGTWSSSNASVATISASGVATELGSGTATISYTKTLACGTAFSTVTYSVGIYTASTPITGSSTVCVGSSISLDNSTTGGIWSSSAPAVAVAGSISNSTPRGSITGISRGVAIISYTVGTGVCGGSSTMSLTVNGASPSYSSSGITGGRVCAGDSLLLMSDTVTASSWSWAGPNGFTSTLRNPAIAGVTAAASGVYTFTATTAGCTAGRSQLWVPVGNAAPASIAQSAAYICPGGALSLTATASPVSPASYITYAIPYSLQTLSASATVLPPGDDGFYYVSLPFTFNFYGVDRTSLYVNINGSVSFEAGTSAYTAPQLPVIPSSFSFIGLGMADVYTMALGSVSYETIGSAPNRKFVVYYKDCSSYASGGAVGNGTLTGQIVLYETTNVVELMIGRCDLRSASAASSTLIYTFGMQNSDGSSYVTPPGLNYTLNPVLAQQGWRFGHPVPYTYAWAPAATLNNATITNPVSTGLSATQIFTLTTTDINSACTSGTQTRDTVIVNAPVISGLTASSASLCAGGNLTLTAGTISAYGPATTYYWSGPGGYSATSASPSVVLTPSSTAASGLYSVTAANAAGCAGLAQTRSVTVTAQPTVAGITPSATTLCAGSPLTLTAGATTGIGILTSYNWSGPGGYITSGISATAVSIPTNTTASGNYSLTVTYPGAGCTSAAAVTPASVTVNALPVVAGVTPSVTTLCVGNPLTLTAGTTTGTAGLVSYTWSGPGGYSASGTATIVVFTPTATAASGVYSLTVTSGATSCTSNVVTTPSVTVSQLSVSFSPSLVCANMPTQFLPCNGASISLGTSGSASTGVFYTGTDNITMEGWVKWAGGNGHNQVLFYNGDVTANGYGAVVNSASGNVVSIFMGGRGFFNTSAVLTAGVWQYVAIVRNAGTWSLYVDGVAYTVASPTTAPIVPSGLFLAGNGSVGGALQLNGNIRGVSFWSAARTAAQIQADGGVCSFPVQSSLLGYWLFSEGSGSSAIDGSGNNRTLSLAGTTSSSTIATYAWSYGDGGTSTAIAPSHTYTTAGAYTASLTVTGASGCTATSSSALTIATQPSVASVTPSATSVCTGSILTLAAGSTSGTVTTYNWSGPGSYAATGTSATNSVNSSSVAASAVYSLSVTSADRCISAVVTTTPVAVIARPTVASITPSATVLCIGSLLTLTAGTATGTGTLTSYNWSGPGGYSTSGTTVTALVAPANTAASGNYSLTVTYSTAGCISPVVSVPVTVNALPTVSGITPSVTTLCAGSQLTLTAGASTGTGTRISYNWSGPSGYSASGTGVTAVRTPTDATASGNYIVTVTYPGVGCISSAAVTSVPVTVNDRPTVSGITSSAATLCAGGTFTLAAGTTTGGGSGVTYNWTGPNGYYATGTAATVAFTPTTTAASGAYSLAVTSGVTGCISTVAVTPLVTVLSQLQVVPFTSSSFCANAPTLFVPCSGTSISLGTSGSASIGVFNTAIDNITMEGWVKWTGGNGQNQVLFYNGNVSANGFGAVVNSAASNVVSIFMGGRGFFNTSAVLTAGTWQYVAIVRNAGTWVLYLDGIAYAVTSPTTTPNVPSGVFLAGNGSVGGALQLNGSIYGVSFWSVARTVAQVQADRTTCSLQPQPGLQAYWPFSEGSGSSAIDASGNSRNLALSGTTWLSAIANYAWSYGDGGTSTSTSPSSAHSYSVSAAYVPSLTVTNSQGCTASYSGSVFINPSPVIAGVTATGACTGTTLTLTAGTVTGGGTIASYNWSGPAGYSATTTASTATLIPAAAATGYVYSLTAAYTNGCSNVVPAITSPVNISATPVVSAITGDTTACGGESITLANTTAGGVWSSSNVAIATITAGIVSAVSAGTSTMSYAITNVCGTAVATKTVHLSPMQWTGATSSDWNTITNWTCGRVPTITDDIMIPATAVLPVLPATATGVTRMLTLMPGAAITLGAGAQIDVKGDLWYNGSTGEGKVSLSGTAAQKIHGVARINELELNNAAGVTIDSGARLVIGKTLSVTAGVLTTNDSLILASDINGSGRIAALPAAGAAIAGKVKVQQYIQANYRRYRFWSHPFSTALSLGQLQPYMDITGTGGAANGFTATGTNAPSAFRLDPNTENSTMGYDPGWKPITQISGTEDDSNKVNRYQGLRLFMRGAKGEGLGGWTYTPSENTVAMAGPVNQGNQTVTLHRGHGAIPTQQDFNMVGNPYPSPVDIGTAIYNASLTGDVAGVAYFVYNASLGAAGQFQAIMIGSGAPDPYSIQANACFQVRAGFDNAQLHFTESMKTPVATTYLLKPATRQYVSLNIYDNNYHPWDMLTIMFNDKATDAEDVKLDAVKPSGADFNFYSISADNRKMAVDSRPYTTDKVIPLGVSSAYQQEFVIRADNMAIPDNTALYLHDKLLNKNIELQPGTEYRFTIDNNKATQGDNRFELNLKPAITTPAATDLSVTMAPNPANDDVKIVFRLPAKEQVKIRVMDVTGMSVYNREAGVQQSGSVTIPLAGLASGVYIVEVTAGDKTIVQRLVKE